MDEAYPLQSLKILLQIADCASKFEAFTRAGEGDLWSVIYSSIFWSRSNRSIYMIKLIGAIVLASSTTVAFSPALAAVFQLTYTANITDGYDRESIYDFKRQLYVEEENFDASSIGTSFTFSMTYDTEKGTSATTYYGAPGPYEGYAYDARDNFISYQPPSSLDLPFNLHELGQGHTNNGLQAARIYLNTPIYNDPQLDRDIVNFRTYIIDNITVEHYNTESAYSFTEYSHSLSTSIWNVDSPLIGLFNTELFVDLSGSPESLERLGYFYYGERTEEMELSTDYYDQSVYLDTVYVNMIQKYIEFEITSISVNLIESESPAPVPVPAAAPLLLAGLGALGFAARRRKAA